eukprot:07949_6
MRELLRMIFDGPVESENTTELPLLVIFWASFIETTGWRLALLPSPSGVAGKERLFRSDLWASFNETKWLAVASCSSSLWVFENGGWRYARFPPRKEKLYCFQISVSFFIGIRILIQKGTERATSLPSLS